jgi:hypothetical protein
VFSALLEPRRNRFNTWALLDSIWKGLGGGGGCEESFL